MFCTFESRATRVVTMQIPRPGGTCAALRDQRQFPVSSSWLVCRDADTRVRVTRNLIETLSVHRVELGGEEGNRQKRL